MEEFEPAQLGAVIFRDRYARGEEETWKEACRRVAHHVATAEDNGKVKKYEDRFYDQLITNRFNPGGRIWYGSGRPKAQLLNCVPGHTLVHTEEGLVPAGELEGRTIGTLSDGGIYRQAQWFSYGEQEIFSIRLANGDELEATAEHEWVVTKPKGGTERVKTIDLEGRRIPVQHRKIFSYYEESWKKGVQHGLTWGDGNLYMKGNYALLQQFGDSRHLIEDFFEDYREWNRENLVVTKLPKEWKTSLPIATEDQSYARGFIAGVIAADGCVDNRGHVMLHSSDLDSLVRIRYLATEVGLPSTSIKLVRTHNPWTGEEAPLWKLTFVKAGFFTEQGYDPYLILKQKHREYISTSPIPKKRQTMLVESVTWSGGMEEVYCCVEPETHTMVIGPGYLTGQCFVVPAGDSREAWGKTASDVIIISGLMGGVGVNLSPIRGRGSIIKGTGGVATGSVSYGQLLNGVGNVIVGGGGRRMAMMMALALNHPDVEEFLKVKLDLNELNNANISLIIPEDLPTEDFVQMVREGKDIELEFNGVPSGKTINARKLCDTLVENAYKSGEPGVLNGYVANKQNNIWYHKPLICTNPCGEIWLEAYGCCDLGALVLPRFVRDGDFDWDALDETVRLGVRFLDNVLSVNHYPLPEIKENCEQVRRLGLGVMGLHTMLLEMGMRYDSQEAFDFVERLFSTIKNTSYDASINLAIEKGPFPAYDLRFLDSGFTKTLKRGIRNKIREHGIRNCALMTIAPTGTTSMVAGVSSGIEPIPAPVYWRNYFKPTKNGHRELQRELVVEEALHKYPHNIVQSAIDVPLEAHFRMQSIVQKHIDNAVSKTINMAKDADIKEFSEMWLKYLPHVKGTTVYRFGSRENEPIQPIPREQWDEVVGHEDAHGEMTVDEFMSVDCIGGVCEIPSQWSKTAA